MRAFAPPLPLLIGMQSVCRNATAWLASGCAAQAMSRMYVSTQCVKAENFSSHGGLFGACAGGEASAAEPASQSSIAVGLAIVFSLIMTRVPRGRRA
eukprot:scaffold1330_cov240-Pinguiococcus_pyrenoidosus.AAC.11